MQLSQLEIRGSDAGNQDRVAVSCGVAGSEPNRVAPTEGDDLARVRSLIVVHRELSDQRRARSSTHALGALRYAIHKVARPRTRERGPWRARAPGEWRPVEERDHCDMGRRSGAASGSTGWKRQHELGDHAGVAAGATRVKSSQREPCRGGAVRREHRRAAGPAGFDSDQCAPRERIGEPAGSRQLPVEIARIAVTRDENVRLAAEAPPERRRMPATGGRAGPRQ